MILNDSVACDIPSRIVRYKEASISSSRWFRTDEHILGSSLKGRECKLSIQIGHVFVCVCMRVWIAGLYSQVVEQELIG